MTSPSKSLSARARKRLETFEELAAQGFNTRSVKVRGTSIGSRLHSYVHSTAGYYGACSFAQTKRARLSNTGKVVSLAWLLTKVGTDSVCRSCFSLGGFTEATTSQTLDAYATNLTKLRAAFAAAPEQPSRPALRSLEAHLQRLAPEGDSSADAIAALPLPAAQRRRYAEVLMAARAWLSDDAVITATVASCAALALPYPTFRGPARSSAAAKEICRLTDHQRQLLVDAPQWVVFRIPTDVFLEEVVMTAFELFTTRRVVVAPLAVFQAASAFIDADHAVLAGRPSDAELETLLALYDPAGTGACTTLQAALKVARRLT